MEIFITSQKIIKCVYESQKNDISIFYDYIHDDDINLLNNYLLDGDINTIYGSLNKKNFTYSIINVSNEDYLEIEQLLKNKHYKPIIKLNNLIADIKNKTNTTFNFEKIYQDAIDSLTIYTETLKNENTSMHLTSRVNISMHSTLKNNNYNDLTEYLSDNDSDDDYIQKSVFTSQTSFLTYAIDNDDLYTMTNI